MREVLEQRTLHGKTHVLPDGRIQVSSSIAPIHWDDGGKWVDVDCTPISHDGGETWTTRSTPYELLWDVEALTLSFTRKKGGSVKVRLVALDDIPLRRQFIAPTVQGNSVRALIAPEFEIELRTRSHDVEIFKILHGPKAPRRITWEVTENAPGVHLRMMETTGKDNAFRLARRAGEINRQRQVEILHSRVEIDERTYRVTEEFTGRTRFIHPETRARTWVEEVVWPVEIDVTVSVNVTANQDDGNGIVGSTYWYQNAFRCIGYSGNRYGACRFLSVNVPQGQTLDSATLAVNVTGRLGSQNSTLAGNNVDSAAAWANGSANGPAGMAKTTATTVFATPATTGVKNIDVKTICQEIINRAGWAANNNLRLGWTDVTAMTTSYFAMEDFSAAGANPANLSIVYTAGAAAANNLIKNAARLAWI